MRHCLCVGLLALAAATAAAQEARVDLGRRIDEALALVQDPRRFHAGNALELLSRGYEELFSIDPAALDLEKIDAEPEALNRRVFELVLAIDDRMAGFYREGKYPDELANAKRRVLRGLRFLREQVLVRAHRAHPERLYAGGRPGFATLPPTVPGLERYHWTANPAYFDQLLEPSRLPRVFFILNEGDLTLSAAIARSSSEDNMFSHYSIGYVSDREQEVKGRRYPAGTLFTIESLIEHGVVIEPFEYHWSKALLGWSAREAFFFLRDRSKQAALDAATDAFFERAREALNAGKPLGYDFSMGTANDSIAAAIEGVEAGRPAPKLLEMQNYFCSGVAEALGLAAGVELFTSRSRLEPGPNARALFVRWGLDPDRPLASPGDGDVSAALVRVAEGAYLDKLESGHMRHAIMERVFTWIDRDGYQVRAPGWFKAGTKLITKVNDQVAGTLLDLGKVPNGITPEIIQSLVPIQHTIEAFLKPLRAADERSRRERGRSLTPAEMAAFLEEVRPEVDVDRWFVRGAQGRYALVPTRPWPWSKKGATTSLVVEPAGEAGQFRVVREVSRDGQVIGRGEGTARQEGKRLKVTFTTRSGEQPETIGYTIERDGRIEGGLSPVRREKGRRVE